jgi:ribosomal protein S27AE
MRRWASGCARCGGVLSFTWLRSADGSIEKHRWCPRCDGPDMAAHFERLAPYRQIMRLGVSLEGWQQ